MTDRKPIIGPILILDEFRDADMHCAALFVAPTGVTPGPIRINTADHAPERIASYQAKDVYRIRFALPANTASSYVWNDTTYEVQGSFAQDLRIAYVSCNGEEIGDLDRESSERNAMWARMCSEHRNEPFSLLLHGGDQVYADEVTHGHTLSEDWPDRLPRDPSREDLASLREHLRERFLQRYLSIYAAPEFAWIAARVPSLMQWDDHDICDGWGSLPRSRTYSPVGQTLFSVARESFLTFQHGLSEEDLSARFQDPDGAHLGWAVQVPGLRIIAPDLRSERTRRTVMWKGGWQTMSDAAEEEFAGRTFLMSSVPLLGPRLSLIEMIMVLIPKMQKYEDDLRDQWQSRAHRAAWRRMLRLVLKMAAREEQQVTALSGEIHLANRAELRLSDSEVLHQLVASGIAHRAPPKTWARILGTLASLGEDPLPDHPISVRRIPGQDNRYVAERNYLILERNHDNWTATWNFESSGISTPLSI